MAHLTHRDDNAPHATIEHTGSEVSYFLVEQDGVLQWTATFIDEIPTEQHNSPSPYSYSDAPATISQVLAFENWSDGAGFVDAPAGSADLNGYSYSRGVDASEGKLVVSPKQTEMDTGDVWDGMYFSPTYGVYAWAGTTLYKLSTGDWVLKYTAAANITDLIEYGNSTAVYLFLALGDSNTMVYSTDGFVTAPTAVTGDENASYLAIRGNSSIQPVLFAITANGLLRSSVNPVSDANWSNADRIGSSGETVTKMVVANDLIWIFKEEGFYTFDGTNVGAQVPVDQLTRTGNGSEAYVWLNGFIYVNYANRLLKINPFDNTTEVLIAPAHPEVNGTITAITGDTRWLYVFMKNSALDTYCLKVNPESGVTHTYMFFDGGTVNAALVVPHSADSVSTTNEALIFGLSTGD